MNTSFDVLILGSGPAGQKAALNAAKLGKKVALVDRVESLGGVCIHTGTIPSKAMREAVLHLTGMNLRQVYGESYAVKDNITMADLLYRCQHVIRTETEVIRNQMRRNRISMYHGLAQFTGPNTVRIVRADGETRDLHGEHILVAVGTEPAHPANVPFTPNRVIDSTELLTLTELPRSITIVGGGVIGTEYACMMAAVGVKVTLVESRPRLLEFIDEELTEALQFRLREGGVRLRLNESVAKIEVHDDAVVATMASNKTIHSQTLLYCIGRQGATANLGLENAGLTPDNRGRLKVNEHFQTEVPHIYAAGDVIGFPALASTSMEQGRQASNHMFGQYQQETSPLYPLGIYTIPEMSLVGQTEQQLTAAGVPYEVGIARYREIARGQLIADPHGLLKLLFHPLSRRLLGVHAIGTGATELIHIGQTVMAAGMPIDYFVDTVFNYPTLAECYKVAALDGINRVRQVPMEPDHGFSDMEVDSSGDVKEAA
ncbi:MAG: sthA [Phycisphaerales bacterium]|nr:sthA [Phycisphaerales bacterium]